MSLRLLVALSVAVVSLGACRSEGPSGGSQETGGASGTGGSGGASGGGGGGASGGAMGGAGGSGGAAGRGGSSGQGGAGTTGGAGSGGGAVAGNGAGNGGGASDAGAREAGATDSAPPADDLVVASAINGQRWELHCGTSVEGDQVCENFPSGSGCPNGGFPMLNKTVTFGGTKGTVYDVAIRVRGVVEPRTYAGGLADGKHFYVGGTPSGDNNYNVYSLSVSAPKQIYYFNGDEGMGTGHRVFTVDHVKTIKIEGGAKVVMVAFDSNCSAIRNCVNPGPNCTPYVVPGVPPAPAAWNGQFLQLDVTAVVATK